MESILRKLFLISRIVIFNAMEKQDYIKYWVKTSEEDLKSMESVFQAEKYDWSLFIGHLSLEKVLKAL